MGLSKSSGVQEGSRKVRLADSRKCQERALRTQRRQYDRELSGLKSHL